MELDNPMSSHLILETDRRKSPRVSLPVKIIISNNDSSNRDRKTFLDTIVRGITFVNFFSKKKSRFIEGALEDISSGGALIKVKMDNLRRLSYVSGLFSYDGGYLVVSNSPLRVELLTPSGAHITACDFYIKRLKISGDYLYMGGEFSRCDGRMLLPLPPSTSDTAHSLIISW